MVTGPTPGALYLVGLLVGGSSHPGVGAALRVVAAWTLCRGALGVFCVFSRPPTPLPRVGSWAGGAVPPPPSVGREVQCETFGGVLGGLGCPPTCVSGCPGWDTLWDRAATP